MTSRFVWVVLVAVVTTMFPHAASAQTTIENKTSLVFEIKNLKLTTADIANAINNIDQAETEEVVVNTSNQPLGPVAPIAPVTKVTAKKTAYVFPPKITGETRIFMQEPEIRAYVCPKLGSKCNIFIAILKGENGTHECTRDNRGLNRNGSVDIGLAQINWKPGSPYTFEQLQDCKFNLDVALSMYARRGFQPWYAYTKGSYLKHMPAVLASAKTIAEAIAPKEAMTN